MTKGISLDTISDTLKVTVKDNILIVALNRPSKCNAVNDDMVLALEKVFSHVPKNVKCAIIYGEGPHFSAGLDCHTSPFATAQQRAYRKLSTEK